jgi:SAM-dependent MidA family methyltransferase
LDQLYEKLAAEIRIQGAISFARFMELALYCPVYGYYEKEGDTVGRKGDFYTSVSVGSLFGQLLAVQFADWLTERSKVQSPKSKVGPRATVHGPQSPSRQTTVHRVGPRAWPVRLIEAGAHDGQLAKDILQWFRNWRKDIFERLEYWIIEPSERRWQWQKESLSEFSSKVKWARDLAEFAHIECGAPDNRVVFCNELLDAMPVHRWGWDGAGKTWFQWGVSLDQERFVWTRMPGEKVDSPQSANQSPPSGFYFPPELTDVLPDGFTVETCPAAIAWWRQAASVVRSGRLVAIDYGLSLDELVIPERSNGTLCAYRHHQLSPDVLADPGQQDLTAHINFSALQQCGESSGLKTEGLITQSQFLTSIATRIWNGELAFEEWTPKHLRQFQTLTSPEHLGGTFRVLVQSR